MSWLRRLGYGLGGVAALLVLLLAGVYGFSARRLARSHAGPPAEVLAVPTDPASAVRGAHIARAITKCGDCHGQDMGGRLFLDAGPMIGKVYAPNITAGKGSVTAGFSTADWERAIRHGLARDGRALKIMPSEDYVWMSDADLGDLLAYIRSLPAVDREIPSTTIGPVGRALLLAGKFPILAAERLPLDGKHPTVETGVTVEYGSYLANVGGCTGCHGPHLSGGRIPGTPPDIPPSRNLTPQGIGSWTEADFFRALRTGVRPDGSTINAFMPWMATRHMTDDEIRALWLYLRSVPPRPSGTM